MVKLEREINGRIRGQWTACDRGGLVYIVSKCLHHVPIFKGDSHLFLHYLVVLAALNIFVSGI